VGISAYRRLAPRVVKKARGATSSSLIVKFTKSALLSSPISKTFVSLKENFARSLTAPFIRTLASLTNTKLTQGVKTNFPLTDMSIEKPSNDPGNSRQANTGARLTMANLAAHGQDTSNLSPGRTVRRWLNSVGTSSGRFVDDESWMRLAEADSVAAAIEATMRGGDQSEGKEK
jgi:hypothetical protein